MLEETSPARILATKKRTDDILRYEWNYYSELAYQRKRIEPELLDALRRASSTNFAFDHWQRAVKYRYGLHPLSSIGSLSSPGGRFNIGDVNLQLFARFPALYLAGDHMSYLSGWMAGALGSARLVARRVHERAAREHGAVTARA